MTIGHRQIGHGDEKKDWNDRMPLNINHVNCDLDFNRSLPVSQEWPFCNMTMGRDSAVPCLYP